MTSLTKKYFSVKSRTKSTVVCAFLLAAAAVATPKVIYLNNLHNEKTDANNRSEKAQEFITAISSPENWDDINVAESEGVDLSFDETVSLFHSRDALAAYNTRAFIISDGDKTSLLMIGRTGMGFIESGLIPLDKGLSKIINAEMGYNAPFDEGYEFVLVNKEDDSISINQDPRTGVVVVAIDKELSDTDIIREFGILLGNSRSKIIDFGGRACVAEGSLRSLNCTG